MKIFKLLNALVISGIFASSALAQTHTSCGPCVAGVTAYGYQQVCQALESNGHTRGFAQSCNPNVSAAESCHGLKVQLEQMVNEGVTTCSLAQLAYNYGPDYISCGSLVCVR